MKWKDCGKALIVNGDTDYESLTDNVLTSTSTVVVEDSSGKIYLRMFGVREYNLALLAPDVLGPPPPDCGSVEQGVENISYVESDHASATSLTIVDDLAFNLLPFSVVGDFPLKRTCVPAVKLDKLLLDATGAPVPCTVQYKDPHVLRLPSAGGWLMLLARNHAPTGHDLGMRVSVNDIVAFWAPDTDSSFTSDSVRGPFLLVDTTCDMGFALSLGVPAAIVVSDDAGEMLYVYYTAETSRYPSRADEDAAVAAGFHSGTRLRKIALEAIYGAIDYVEIVKPDIDYDRLEYLRTTVTVAKGLPAAGRLTYLIERGIEWDEWESHAPQGTADSLSAWDDEARWDPLTHAGLIPGVCMGKVRVWIAEGLEFDESDDPAVDAKSNVEIETKYFRFHVVDAVPVACRSAGIVLYFSGNRSSEDLSGGKFTSLYGIWRATVLPFSAARLYGMDFVVRPETSETAGERDLIAESAEDRMRVDPDPVGLSGSTWMVYSGNMSDANMAKHAVMSGIACASAASAW